MLQKTTRDMKKTITILSLAALIGSCGSKEQKTEEPVLKETDTVKVDNTAVETTAPIPVLHYAGTLPCADCAGIQTELTLMPDSTWSMHIIYDKRPAKGPGSNESSEQGKWMMHGDTVHLMGRKDAPSMYIKTDSSLIQLDMKGKKIEGKLADKYILKKI